MTDGDEILSGFVIAGMVTIGISCIGYFIRKRCNKSNESWRPGTGLMVN
jgi:hypothetical protein